MVSYAVSMGIGGLMGLMGCLFGTKLVYEEVLQGEYKSSGFDAPFPVLEGARSDTKMLVEINVQTFSFHRLCMSCKLIQTLRQFIQGLGLTGSVTRSWAPALRADIMNVP